MAHPTSIFYFGGALVWCDFHLQRTARSLRVATRTTVGLFVVPAVAIAVFYVVSLRGMVIGGGEPYTFVSVALQTLATLSSGPSQGAGMLIAGVVTGGLFATSIVALYRRGDDQWVFYLMACTVFPTGLVLLQQPPTLYPRYFIVPAAFVLLALSQFVAQLITRGGRPRIAAGGLLALFVAGSIASVVASAQSGRGQYGDLVSTILQEDPRPTVTVASVEEFGGHDFRNALLVQYFSRRLDADARVRYVPTDDYPTAGPDWLIRENPLRLLTDESLADANGTQFRLVERYVSGSLSGESINLYRRVER